MRRRPNDRGALVVGGLPPPQPIPQQGHIDNGHKRPTPPGRGQASGIISGSDLDSITIRAMAGLVRGEERTEEDWRGQKMGCKKRREEERREEKEERRGEKRRGEKRGEEKRRGVERKLEERRGEGGK